MLPYRKEIKKEMLRQRSEQKKEMTRLERFEKLESLKKFAETEKGYEIIKEKIMEGLKDAELDSFEYRSLKQ